MANLTIKRVPDKEIIKVIFEQTDKTITERYLSMIRQQIKKESYHWYSKMRTGQYEYIHEFKERINEILSLQKMHHEIIESNKNNPQIQQTSLAELHKLNITLANYFDVLPDVINGSSISKETETEIKESTEARKEITV